MTVPTFVVLAFVDADGTGSGTMDLERRYLYGNAVDQVLAQENIDETTSSADRVHWHLTDHLGTVRDLAKNDGTAGEHYEYDAYGGIVAGDTSLTRYLFTGREFDEETDLQYNRARWYDPAVGRWISEDPIGFAAGDVNVSRYVANGVTGAVDSSGLFMGMAMPSLTEYAEYANPFKTDVHLVDNWDVTLRVGTRTGQVMALTGGSGALAAGGVSGTVSAIGSVGSSAYLSMTAAARLAWSTSEAFLAQTGRIFATTRVGAPLATPLATSIGIGVAEGVTGTDHPGGIDDAIGLGVGLIDDAAGVAARAADDLAEAAGRSMDEVGAAVQGFIDDAVTGVCFVAGTLVEVVPSVSDEDNADGESDRPGTTVWLVGLTVVVTVQIIRSKEKENGPAEFVF